MISTPNYASPWPVDIVTMIELIEHLNEEDGLNLLREARRTLRSGGRIMISTPNYASPWPVVEWFVNRLGAVSYEDQHISRFNRTHLEALLRRAGFGQVEIARFNIHPLPMATLSLIIEMDHTWRFAQDGWATSTWDVSGSRIGKAGTAR